MNFATIAEGTRIIGHGIATRLRGPRRYEGDAKEICERVVAACWDERLDIFLTSTNNYPLFYARDFGMCVDSLLALGHRERIKRTLAWAISHYERNGRITLVLNRRGKGFNFPDCESPDALAFLLRSLATLCDDSLIERHKRFLEQELQRLTIAVVDQETGLVKRGIHVGGMRDYAIRESGCYDNAMMAGIRKYAEQLRLKNPLQRFEYQKLLISRFWTGTHFKDDMMNDALTGDANVAPLWFRIFPQKKEKELFRKVQRALLEAKLDEPYPLRYEASRETRTRMRWQEIFTGGWERDTVWLHLGNLWLQVLARHDKEALRRELAKHQELIERVRHYPEVLTKEGEPYRALLFHADDTMLWACNWLALARAAGRDNERRGGRRRYGGGRRTRTKKRSGR